MDALREYGWSRVSLSGWTGTAADNDRRLAEEQEQLKQKIAEAAAQLGTMASLADAIRRSLEPVLRRICSLWLRLHGWEDQVTMDWEDINLQDIVEEARSDLYRAQAEQIRREEG